MPDLVPDPPAADHATQLTGPGVVAADDRPPRLGNGPAINPADPAFPLNFYVAGTYGRVEVYPPAVPGGELSGTPVDFPIRSFSYRETTQTERLTLDIGPVVIAGDRTATGELSFIMDSFGLPGTIGSNTGWVNPFVNGDYVKLLAKPDGQSVVAFVALIRDVSYSFGPTTGAVTVNCGWDSHGPIANPTESLAQAPPPLSN